VRAAKPPSSRPEGSRHDHRSRCAHTHSLALDAFSSSVFREQRAGPPNVRRRGRPRAEAVNRRPIGGVRTVLGPWKLNRTVRFARISLSPGQRSTRRPRVRTRLTGASLRREELLRKEVIQPQVPLRLPCYDFTPVTIHSLGPCPLAVGAGTSGANDSHGVTGGVYKARERIHPCLLIRDY
jgi:hypothetical protein